eukprot:TRINITY_DN86717_c0_g1_i1.p1 TRINITY_DN86717_c0_g1~~TRINITY_DN86717_c0_g1_i1.p1  ORF type:complete len:483 (+),score=87.37 TRINITY_DN86717_c0_g1_i1:22-1449(+)
MVSVFLCVLLATISCEASHVLDLNSQGFSDALGRQPLTVVEFYAPWCGHCKKLAPEWEKLATALHSRSDEIAIAKVDSIVERALADSYGVQGYPTILAFKQGNYVKYTGPLQVDPLQGWVATLADKPATATVQTADAALEKIAGSELALVGFPGSDAQAEALEALAFELNPRSNPTYSVTQPVVSVHQSVSREVANSLGISTVPSVALFRKFEFEDPIVVFEGESWEGLRAWWKRFSLPALLKASKESESQFFHDAQPGNGLLVFFSRQGEEDKELRRTAHDFVVSAQTDAAFQGLKFVSALDDDYGAALAAQGFNLRTEDFPTVGLLVFGSTESDDAYYRMPPPFGSTELRNFVQKWRDGALVRIGDPVVTLTSSNFDSIVFDATKHVLVEFYAPWCGHCQRLAPIYKQLAQRLASEPDVVIAKMDATTETQSSVQLRSYPTLVFYSKTNKAEPLKYEGERTVEALANFVQSQQ